MYTLISEQDGTSRRTMLAAGDTIVGRSRSCQLVLDDDSVSRRHARFSSTSGRCTLVDLSSRNGTYVNGRLVQQADLRDGDRIVLGRVPFQVEHGAIESFSLSEHDVVLDGPGTICRPAVQTGASLPGSGLAEERLLRLLVDVGQTLVEQSAPGEVFRHIVRLAFDICPAERAFLVLKDDAAGFVPRVARRRDGTDIHSVSLSRTIVDRVTSDRVAMLATNRRVDVRVARSESLQLQKVQSFMCAPLWDAREVSGVLYVDASLTNRFSSKDLDLLTALANFAGVAIERARLGARVNEEIRRRERLERYHSPAVVNRILEGNADIDTFLAQEREVSVLFADLVGFTALSEDLTPAQTASLLNGFFERMAEIVFRNEGTLDKFIGDGLMIVFGAPIEQPDHAARAARTAQHMQQALRRYNEESTGPPLTMRVAIHSGIVRAGDIGSNRRRDYTILGDVVNTASRLESDVARPGQVVISRATLSGLDDTFGVRPLGHVSLRGRKEPVEVFDLAL